MTPTPDPDAELIALRAEVTHLRRVNQELLNTVAELRATVEQQQAHIDKLVRMAFGRRSERVVTGPTPLDDIPDPGSPISASDAPASPDPPEPATPKRRGHGRRPRPADLPRERVEIDLTEAEKACPCCKKTRIRIGTDVSERLDYRPRLALRPADRAADLRL